MNARFKKLRLGALQRQILDLTSQLETHAQTKGRRHHEGEANPSTATA